jgi:DNA-binding winged helix-turn-helix (wHTH) protein
MGNKSFIFNFADIEVYEREFTLVKAGVVQAVEPKAFRVLLIFLRNPKKLISKEELLNAVWGDAAVTENSLTRSIALLRRLLGDDAHSPHFIETVATVGYRWLCPVEQREEPTPVGEPAAPPNVATAAEPTARTAPPPLARRRWTWVLSAGTATALLLAGAYWYLSRPLPPPRITAYTQITHDGREKLLVGTDGSRLYFTQMQPKALAQVGVSGGEVAQIPAKVPGIFYLLDVAPDGSNLLVQGLEEGGIPGIPLFNVATLGGTVRRVGYAESAAFSPDGNSIAYTTETGELWLVRSDGTGAHKLALVGGDAANLHWSPDGGVIGFDTHESLWAISSDGSNLHQVLPGWHSASGECCGRWTPDGKFYLFLDSPSVSGIPGGRGQIWALDERRWPFRDPTAKPVQLTQGPISWSPPIPGKDGTTIFSEGRTPRGELCRFD